MTISQETSRMIIFGKSSPLPLMGQPQHKSGTRGNHDGNDNPQETMVNSQFVNQLDSRTR